MSGWLLIAFPAKAFTHGLSAVWVGLACVLGDALNWISVSKRLREQTERLRALTLPEFLEQRFAKQDGYAVPTGCYLRDRGVHAPVSLGLNS